MKMPKLGPVQASQDIQQKFAGSGFTVQYANGRPAVTFGFLSEAEASAAHAKMRDIIEKCKYMKVHD